MSLKEHFELMAAYNQWMNEKVYDAAGARFPLRTPAQHGKIPLLELDSGETLSESNAILYYLASGSDLYPHGGLAPGSGMAGSRCGTAEFQAYGLTQKPGPIYFSAGLAAPP
ncbi:hypothetical protein BKP64_07130 [Marinobacter salinus]|uniref:GST N-terminal domain-containing protein n=1 Tax=Marinobacter salinus TaxID=1874317 RepID=A0A1D9GK78_9GAMM|nr:glutathione S-transferase family protein [Marinobacter salinus]AOY87961.1 hypothetical protein BKP64_07130 [Marinobacter salinus]